MVFMNFKIVKGSVIMVYEVIVVINDELGVEMIISDFVDVFLGSMNFILMVIFINLVFIGSVMFIYYL